MQELEGKRALITGAGQGVGLGIATDLAGAGAHVYVNDLDADRAEAAAESLRRQDRNATALPFDVTDRATIHAALKGVGNIDILVNNVGNAGRVQMTPTPFADFPMADADHIIQSNLYGVIHCTQEVLPGMCARGFGRVITIGSEAGRQGLNIGVSIYGAAKAAIANLMRHISLEVARHNVTCNTVSIGLMNNVPPEFTDAVIASIPAGRLGTPEDVGAMCTFLASERASWITGQEMVINGGSSVRG